MRVFVVLPAYNEERALPPLVESLHAHIKSVWGADYRIVIVNDGSRDNTLNVAKSLAQSFAVDVLDNGQNRGLAKTLLHGMRHAMNASQPDDVIVTMDGDNTQPAGLIPRMLTHIREGSDVVIGSRYREGSHVRGLSRSRRFLSFAASWVFRIVFPTQGVRDFTCGFRAYRAGMLQSAYRKLGDDMIAATGFSCMVELLLKLRQMDAVFTEVPMILRYDQKHGASKMRVLKTITETLLLIVRRKLGIQRDPSVRDTSERETQPSQAL